METHNLLVFIILKKINVSFFCFSKIINEKYILLKNLGHNLMDKDIFYLSNCFDKSFKKSQKLFGFYVLFLFILQLLFYLFEDSTKFSLLIFILYCILCVQFLYYGFRKNTKFDFIKFHSSYLEIKQNYLKIKKIDYSIIKLIELKQVSFFIYTINEKIEVNLSWMLYKDLLELKSKLKNICIEKNIEIKE